MAPEKGNQPDANHTLKIGPLRKLERLELGREIGFGQRTLSGDAEQSLRALGTVRRQLNLASGRYAMIDNGFVCALIRLPLAR